MSAFGRLFLGLNLLMAGLLFGSIALAEVPKRIVSVGGSVTEIIYALGQQDRLIGRDRTSSYPAAALALPDIGYARALSPEGVLSVAPDMIIAIEGAGPPETLDVLKNAQVDYVPVPEVFSADGITAKIRIVGAALGEETEAEALAQKVAQDLRSAEADAASVAGEHPKKVLFILSTRGGRIMAGGANSAADGIIRMAGAINAVTEFDGYKPMTDEAIAQAAPDVILMMDRGGDHGIAIDALLAMPSIAPTPAAQNAMVVRMNGLHLLGFGPRTASAITELNQALYSEAD
ncbi:hemin ABC transporter substrate-binding protein [Phaeobacter inhibens]|uniref:heme/hemin ABC transporter substrate-binding protein n=1 Tax=Phaeobacter inhibens TaxID=221822 RepID=UPI0027735F37|nr:ABC transporter substrate-binding protein [Phaeobacter inhibens]GLO72065.1 hemin ABC transporter substrate-binding protein [Phaeobacter inhibens]